MALDFPDSSIQQTYLAPNGTTYIWNGTSWVVTPVLPVSRGGTGFTTYAHGDILYGDSSKQLNKLTAGTSGHALFTNGPGADPYWGSVATGQTIASSTNSTIAFYSGTGSSIKGRSGFTVNDSNGTVGIDMSDTSYAFHIRGSGNVSKYRFDTDNSILHLSAGSGKSAELRLYTGDYSYYTGLKPNATANKTYILPSTTPASGTSVLQSDSDGVMSWVQMSTGGGAGTVSIASVNEIAGYYAGAGSSVKGSSTFTNDITNGTVTIGHTTNSTGINSGALTVTGGVGIGGSLFVGGNSVSLFQSVANNYLYLNTGTNVLRIQTDVATSRVRMFENMTTGTLGFFGTSGGTLYLGTDSGTANGNITIRGNNTTGGGGNQRAASFTLATATSNGTGMGGTMLFQTSTSSPSSSSSTNALRTRLRIEGAATGTSNLESIIVLGESTSGTAWTSYIRGVDASGTDVAAGEIQIQAGRSTGTANAQGISFYVSPSSTTSSTLNTANQIGRFTGTGLTIYSSTASISTTTGALIVSGGVGIGGSLNVGALSKYSDHVEIKTAKELRFYNPSDTQYIGIKAGNVISANKTFTLPLDYGNSGQYLSTDGLGTLSWISGNGTVGNGSQNQVALYSSIGNSVLGSSTFTNDTSEGIVSITHVTTSTGFSTGALVVTGGVGIGGSLRIGDSTTSGSTVTGALTVRGGVGIGNNLYVAGLLSISSTTNLFGAINFLNETSTVTIQNRIIKSGSIALSMSATTLNGAVLQVQQANIKETGIGGTSTVGAVVPAISFRKHSFSATNPNITYSKAANVYIEDAPDSSVTGAVGSGNTYTVAITNSYALYVENGRSYFGGALDAPGTYRCSIGLATDQTIAASGDTTPNFTSISDPNSWWNATTKRLTPTIAGWYYVNYQVNWDAASITNNQCNIQMRKNAATFSIAMMQLLSGNPYSMSCSGMINVNGSSDYLDFTVYTSNTTSQVLNGEAAQQYTRVDMFKIQ
jgi:hypothetical protein